MQLAKWTQGEHFPGLDMLTTLLPSKPRDLRRVGEKPLLEELGGGAREELEGKEGGAREEEEEFNWEVEQNFPSEAGKVGISQRCPF